ncbi:hypothetical protein [Hoeflea sp.]|uniref:hypothetical protein n=1 Tax=Hoeflea sp. TaxID=1940281 RepID=UPI003B02E562
MNHSQRFAAVLGPALVVATTSETINLHIWETIDPTVVYLDGLFLLIAGLVVTTNHNRWQLDAGLLVTVTGCMLVLAGAYRMYFPTAPQLDPDPATYLFIAVLCMLGLALSLFAFAMRRE